MVSRVPCGGSGSVSVTFFRDTIFEETTPTFLARLMRDASGVETAVVQADVSTITYQVWLEGTLVNSGSLTVSDVVYNTLQTGSIWTQDTTGFNFKHKLSDTNFVSGNKTYTVIHHVTLTGGDKAKGVWQVTTHDIPEA